MTDSERFSELFSSSYGRIRAYAARRVGAGTADEVAAETFLTAWRRLEELPPDPLPWLYGVARNIVKRQYAAQARQAATVGALSAEPGPAPIDPDGGDPAVWEAWRALSDADREVLALIAWEELPVRDAALALGCSAPVFSVRLHRARRRFESLLVRERAPRRTLTDLPEAS